MRGDFTPGKTIRFRFNTHKADGTPITLAGTPAISVYKDGSTTESTTGVTLTVGFDSLTGMHLVEIDTSADGTFYAAGSDFDVVITTGTVDSISVVGMVVGEFSLSNRSALRPTTADRTLDVSAGGEAGVDWANVGSPTTTVNLSGTTVKTATDVETDTADIQTRLPAALTAGGNIKADVLAVSGDTTAADNAEAFFDGTGYAGTNNVIPNVTTVGSVTTKTGYSLAATGLDLVVVAEPGDEAGWGDSVVVMLAHLMAAGGINPAYVTRTSSTAGTITVRNFADNATLWTHTLTDTGSVSTRGKAT